MSLSFHRVLASVTAAALCAVPLTSAVASPAQAASAPSGSFAVADKHARTHESFTVSAHPGKQFAGRIAVVEEDAGKGKHFQLGSGIVHPDGSVKIKVQVAEAGKHLADVRIVKQRRTLAVSEPFEVTVDKPAAGKGVSDVAGARAERLSAHEHDFRIGRTPAAQSKPAKAAKPTRLGIDPVDPEQEAQPESDGYSSSIYSEQPLGAGEGSGAQAFFGDSGEGDAGAAAGLTEATGAAVEAEASTFGAVKDFAKSAVRSASLSAVSGLAQFGVMHLLYAIDPAARPDAMVLSALRSDFDQMESQLSAITTQLNDMEVQLDQISTQLQQTNATAAQGLCSNLLGQANEYVTAIQTVNDNYQEVLNEQWMDTNIAPARTSSAAMNTVGAYMFGQGAGNPTFLSSLNGFQQQVTNLSNLLTSGGPDGTPGVIQACATAIAAEEAVNYPSFISSTGITKVGSVDNEYFTHLQKITSFYASWATLGQTYAAFGGQMAANVLDPNPNEPGTDICVGTPANSSPGPISTCAGIVGTQAQTTAAVNAAWNLTGASWGQVSYGALASDANVAAGQNYLVPARNIWVTDIALYGNGPNQTVPPLSSLSAGTGPASGTNMLSDGNWLGLNFVPATSWQWTDIIPPATPAFANGCSGAPCTTGALMSQAGLANGGTAPNNLIVYTDETEPFNFSATTNANWFQTVYGSISANIYPPDFQVFEGQANNFLDSNFTPQNGQNVSAFSVIPGTGTSPGMTSFLTGGTNLDAVQGGQYGEEWMYKNNGLQFNKTGNPSWNTTFTMAPGVTQNASFYSPLQMHNQMSVAESTNGPAATNFDNMSNSISATPNFLTGNPQKQYLWPMIPMQYTGCTMTSFTEGVYGGINTTQTCVNLWEEYAAAVLGLDFGSAGIAADTTTNTLTQGGNNTVPLVVTNTASSPQTVVLTASSTDGNTNMGAGVVSDAQSPSVVTVNSCQTDAAYEFDDGAASWTNNVQCSITLPVGSSIIDVPIVYNGSNTSGGVAATLSSGTVASSTQTTAMAQPQLGMSVPQTPLNFQVALDASTASSQDIALSWLAPSSNPAISSYQVSFQDPDGVQSNQTIALSAVAAAGAMSTASVPLPSASRGSWVIQLAAVNANGAGSPARDTVFLGQAPPPPVAGLAAELNADGSVSLSWQPEVTLPAVTHYTIVQTDPDGTVEKAVVTTVPEFVNEHIEQTGVYQFSVTATNAMGTSTASPINLNVTGRVPDRVRNLSTQVSADGLFTVEWEGADSVPAPTSYNLAIYGPNAKAVLTQDYAVSSVNSKVSVMDVFQLGNDSLPGMYTAVVTATNSAGMGSAAQSSMFISQAKINHSTLSRVNSMIVGSLPASFQALAAAQCQAGLWQSGFNVFGVCDEVAHAFTSSTDVPAGPQVGPLPTQQVPSDSTKLSTGSASAASAKSGTYSGSYRRGSQKVSWTFTQDNGGACVSVATHLAVPDAFCPLVTAVAVSSTGSWSIGVRNREAGNTAITLHNTFRGVVDSVQATTPPLVDGSGASLVTNVVDQWINPQPGQTGTWDDSYSINGSGYKMTGNIHIVISNL